MIVKLLTEHRLEFVSLKEGGRGWSESKCQIVGNLIPRLKCQISYFVSMTGRVFTLPERMEGMR